MGARGPIPQPAAVSYLRGNPGKRAQRTTARAAPAPMPACPAHLPPAAKAKWRQLVAALSPTGILSPADAAALELACLHYALARKAAAELLAAESLAQADRKNGREMKHPAAQVFRDNTKAFMEFADRLGATPAGRARLAAPEVNDDEAASILD